MLFIYVFSFSASLYGSVCADAAGVSDAERAARGESLSAPGRLGSSWLLLCVCMQKSVVPPVPGAGGELFD